MESYPRIRPDASLLLAWQLKNRRVLIVGGGAVAAGRLDAVLDASARVTLISPRNGLDKSTAHRIFDDEPSVRERIEYIDRDFVLDGDTALVDQADMVLTAIDDVDLSRRICALARERKIPVNVADVPPECDFYFGSQIRDGPLQIMISTGGSAPKLSNLIRKRIEDSLPPPPFLGDAIRQVGALRSRLRKRAPGVGGALGRQRMRWMIKVCEKWSFEELADMDEEMMERMLNEGWNRKLYVPTYEEVGGKRRVSRRFSSLTTASVTTGVGGFAIGALAATAFVLLRKR